MFYFRLARALRMTVARLLAEVDSAELGEWEAYDLLDPLDSDGRTELAVAKVSALLFNANRDRNASEPASAGDYLPKWGEALREAVEESPAMTPDQVKAMMDRFRSE